MEEKHIIVERAISVAGADIFHKYFVEKRDMSRGGLFDEISDEYDAETNVMTVEAEVSETVTISRARKAVEDAFAFAEDIDLVS